jgi:hypothetical protein
MKLYALKTLGPGRRSGSVRKQFMTEKPMSESNRHLQQPYYDGETSLVDLATVFVKRRRVFYGVFGLIFALGLLYALVIAPDVREYTTVIQLAEQSQSPLTSPKEIVSIAQNSWYPIFQSSYQQQNDEQLPSKVIITNPEDTALVRLVTEANELEETVVKGSHQFIFDQLEQHQAERLEIRKTELQQKVSAARARIGELESNEFTLEAEAEAQTIQAITALKDRVDSFEFALETLKPAKIDLLAHRSAEKKGLSKALILALAIVFGLMLGVFTTFMAEFVAQVRSALNEED